MSPFPGQPVVSGQQREDRTSASTVSTPAPLEAEGTLDLRHASTVQPKHGPAVANPRISD